MIDYLERLFAPELPEGAEKTELDFRYSPLKGESVEEMNYPHFWPERMENEPVAAMTEEQFWQEEGARRIAQALSETPLPPSRPDSVSPEELATPHLAAEEPAFGLWEGRGVSRPRERGTGETLERRLRRDSRRYDSGFFWY